jgi:hypothetical protein
LDDAFEHCSNLTRVVFCDMIKSLYLRRWWSIGGINVSTRSASVLTAFSSNVTFLWAWKI